MRLVRPTVRVMRQLPPHMFTNPSDAVRVKRGDRSLLQELDQLEHWIVDAARAAIYEGHRCQQHQSATTSAEQNVFEIEEKSSGWRGAVILDDEGDPWLVYVDAHDAFHRRAKEVLAKAKKTSWYPSAADYKMRDLEDHALAGVRWQGDVARCVLDLLREALDEPQAPTIQLPSLPGTEKRNEAELAVTLDHDAMMDEIGPDRAHHSDSLATITVRLTGDAKGIFLEMFMTVLVGLLGSDPDLGVPGYLPGGHGWVYMVTMSKADLIQLLDLQRSEDGTAPWQRAEGVPRAHKHYIRDQFMMSALVNGHAVRSVCGVWFVPVQDGEGAAALPVCPRCDATKPLAQAVLNLIRTNANSSSSSED